MRTGCKFQVTRHIILILIFMKKLITFFFCLVVGVVFAQKEIKPTSEFIISGEVKTAVTITVDDLKRLKSQSISDVIITNHLGEKKSEARGLPARKVHRSLQVFSDFSPVSNLLDSSRTCSP